MAEMPTTRPSLLVRLRDAGDQEAWRRFVRLYAPVVYGYARRRGLQDADAADLTQDVLRAVTLAARRLGGNGRGSFRSWLFAVARHKLADLRARQGRPGRGSGGSAAQAVLDEQPARDEDEALWDEEFRRRRFTWAAEQIQGSFRDSTWQAFWQTAVEGKSPKQVANGLGMTVAAVYLAKSRVMARLREQIRQLDDD